MTSGPMTQKPISILFGSRSREDLWAFKLGSRMTTLTDRFDMAMQFARQRHHGQSRKGTSIPYVSHLLATAALVLEAGGDEDQAIAGLLHDTLEDGKATALELVERFGERVARIVEDCSDTTENPKPPRRQRKERYIATLASHGRDSVLVSCADKLHNARAILADYRDHGEELWRRFNPEADSLWYYRTLSNAYLELGTPWSEELDRTVTELERLAGRVSPN